jgi:uncharacterized protein YndB with AHSA1/START domain
MGCDILLAVDIDADPTSVYEAITTQKGEAGFWTSDNDTEPAIGSVARFGFPGAEAGAKMRVDELDLGRRVVWTSLGDFPNWKDTAVTWDLEGRAGKTHLMFRHGNWPEDYPDQEFASVAWVWAMVVARLKGYAETGDAQPFFG